MLHSTIITCVIMLKISNKATSKQKPRWDLDGYSSIRDRSTENKTYWRCICYQSDRYRSRLHTCLVTDTVLKQPSEHPCTFDATAHPVRIFPQQSVERASQTQETPDLIISHCYKSECKPISRFAIRKKSWSLQCRYIGSCPCSSACAG